MSKNVSNAWVPSPVDLEGFRTAQRLAYRCAETIAAEVQPGMTERFVAKRMREFLHDEGADDCFHEPFAWFGNRTAFDGFIGITHFGGFNPAFYPGFKRLEEGMPFILDCAPTVKGYTADIGYCGVIGENRVLDKMMDDLREYRQLIVDKVRARDTLANVSRAVDQLAARHGYEPRHKAYPFEVLAHRVEKLSDDGRSAHPSLARFGIRNITELAKGVFKGRREGWSPLWNSSSRSDHRPTPGLWAVEPHLGFRGTGAKFEELLVVTDDDAYWLDDDVPHVRRWVARGLWPMAEKSMEQAA
ncbi:M24 family metallopeptidase [Sinimarinibacterium sp. NLF-5-8]|uniref:M24 family metallopeptidase n=1 Tax=Sinimarinibacterium sp. NLF-5-8 TaxID=2698684 RepID=UPI00137C2CE0|nr:M24 family metallopeptidase [Sinimarinibacterium sp. NLF-5-8]QHS09641.1 aminopeptidase P family protein [Sinimarinibacterium sp. NLF-5-8]